MKNDASTMQEIFSGTLWEAEMVTSLLTNSGIQSFIRNGVLQVYAFNPSRSGEVKVMIAESDTERAAVIVENYCRNLKKDTI